MGRRQKQTTPATAAKLLLDNPQAPLHSSKTKAVPQDGGLPWPPSVLEGMIPDGMTIALVPCIVLTLGCLDHTRVFANCIDCYNNTASKLGIGDASADCFLVWVDNDLHFVQKELTV